MGRRTGTAHGMVTAPWLELFAALPYRSAARDGSNGWWRCLTFPRLCVELQRTRKENAPSGSRPVLEERRTHPLGRARAKSSGERTLWVEAEREGPEQTKTNTGVYWLASPSSASSSSLPASSSSSSSSPDVAGQAQGHVAVLRPRAPAVVGRDITRDVYGGETSRALEVRVLGALDDPIGIIRRRRVGCAGLCSHRAAYREGQVPRAVRRGARRPRRRGGSMRPRARLSGSLSSQLSVFGCGNYLFCRCRFGTQHHCRRHADVAMLREHRKTLLP